MSAAPCVDFAPELVAYLDGEQPAADHAHIEAHLGTCLSCRRELERLRRVRTLLGALPVIAPSAAFHDRMWQRLDPMPAGAAGRRRIVAWGVPALAAAAALALIWYSSATRMAPAGPGTGGAVASARQPAAGGGAGSAESRLAAQHRASPDAGPKPDVAVAGSDLDAYPPELVEHPELFLRYPVVKRLQRLQHFEEVRQHGDGQPLGSATRDAIGPIG